MLLNSEYDPSDTGDFIYGGSRTPSVLVFFSSIQEFKVLYGEERWGPWLILEVEVVLTKGWSLRKCALKLFIFLKFSSCPILVQNLSLAEKYHSIDPGGKK